MHGEVIMSIDRQILKYKLAAYSRRDNFPDYIQFMIFLKPFCLPVGWPVTSLRYFGQTAPEVHQYSC